jgi:hypothetical protein
MDSHIYVNHCFSTQNALDYFKETRESDGRGSSESIDNARHAVEDDRGHDTARSTKLSGHC